MMGKAGSISLACLATSQPSIVPRSLMSVTSAQYLVKPLFSKVTASSPEGAIAGSKPPSVRDSSTILRLVVFHDQNNRQLFHAKTPPTTNPHTSCGRRRIGSGRNAQKCTKVGLMTCLQFPTEAGPSPCPADE